jgi:hypothetical protein
MKPFKITKLNKAETVLVGMSVPIQKDGNIGIMVEDVMIDSGYKLSTSVGVDIPSIETEIKTKGSESKSAYSIGSLHIDTVKLHDYDHSPIKEKCQTIFKVRHSQIFMEITSAKVLNLNKNFIQEKFKDAFDTARNKLIAGDTANYIKGHSAAWGYLERKTRKGKPTNNWAFRITVKTMGKFEGMARSNFDNLFD